MKMQIEKGGQIMSIKINYDVIDEKHWDVIIPVPSAIIEDEIWDGEINVAITIDCDGKLGWVVANGGISVGNDIIDREMIPIVNNWFAKSRLFFEIPHKKPDDTGLSEAEFKKAIDEFQNQHRALIEAEFIKGTKSAIDFIKQELARD